MVICSNIRMGRCRTDYHREDIPRKLMTHPWEFSVPRELVRVWYQFKWFLKLYNLSYSDLSFISWGRNCKKSRNPTYLYGMSDFGWQTDKLGSRVDSVEPGSSWIFFSWIFLFYNYYYNWSGGHKTVQFREILLMAKPNFYFWSTNNSIKDTGNGTLVFEAKVDNLTSKKFWSLMWAENEFWKNTVTDLNMRQVT